VNVLIDFPRDRKDAIFLACALESQADFLITGDRDFEDIDNFNGTKILSVSQFNAFVMGK
jgi:predicted nucleic acid-binding protein